MSKLVFVHRTSDDEDDDDAEEGKEMNYRTFTKLSFPTLTSKCTC
jgi:hypothetical protein